MWGRLLTCGGFLIRLPHMDAPAAILGKAATTVCGSAAMWGRRGTLWVRLPTVPKEFHMKKLLNALALVPLLSTVLLAQRPWQQITVPSVSEAAANFKAPPHEYGSIHWSSWNGDDARERMVRDFDRLVANGVFVVNLSPGRGAPAYLSPEHMSLVKFAVQEARKRGMKLWLQDESDYPSGFAGGKISRQYPQLTMQGLDADVRIRVMAGQTVAIPTPPGTLGVLIVNPVTEAGEVLPVRSGQIKWTAPQFPPGSSWPSRPWELWVVRQIFRSSPTRNSNREDGTNAKDSLYSLIDYLNADATRAYLETTHEVYKQAVGDEFGKTILGFFGDEPDYSGFLPWTPKLLEEFRRQKGYDLQDYVPLFFASKLTDRALRARADYFDVWSGMFRESFFGVQAEWCAQNNLEYLVHLNHEEIGLRSDMPEDLVRNEGDFFRDLRYPQVPGIDNLEQLTPHAVVVPTWAHGGSPAVKLADTPDATWDVNNNFPKLASSAAHLFGKPKVWTEGAGGPGIDNKFQLDFQLVRGLNTMQIRIPVGQRGPGNAAGPPPAIPPQAPMLAWYTNRAGYLMAVGRPAAQVGLYYPSASMWMGDEPADRSMTKLGWQLYAHQVEWDYFDEQSLSSVATIADGGFKNLSGQVYRAIVVPSMSVITRTGLERFQAFVKAGGKVIFVGQTPKLVLDKSFMDAKGPPDLGFATLIEPSGNITPRVLAALPKPDVKLDAEFPKLTYMHRSWRDAEMYFFFNESNQQESRVAAVAGRGQAQAWDLGTGEIHPISGATAEGDSMRIPLVLGPYEAKLVVVGPLPSGVAAPEPPLASGSTLAELGGDWTLDLNGKQVTTPLKSWEALGAPSFAGPATYRKQFTASAAPAGKRVFLEIAEVNDYARVKLNGKELEGHAWQPYRWEVTNAVKAGANELEVEVRTTASGRGGVPAGPGAPAPPAAAAGNAWAAARGRDVPPPPAVSGLLGPVRLVAR